MPFMIFRCFLLLFSCATAFADNNGLIEASKKEGRVSFYTTMAATEGKLFADAFQTKYPHLQVEITRLGSEKILQRILTEHRAGRNLFDVVTNSGFEMHYIKKSGLLARYLSPEHQAFSEDSRDRAGFWADMYSNVRVVAFNTRLVTRDKVPRSYEDLLDPSWRGLIGFPEGQYSWYATMLRVLGEDRGRKFFTGLSRQQLQYRASQVLITQFIAAGEFSLGFVYDNQVLRFKKEGAPLGVAPLPFVTKNMHPVGLAAAAPHPNAAKLFIDFVLSHQGQTLMKNLGRVVSRTDIPQEDIVKSKLIAEDIALADRIGQITEDYKKYLQ
jgi:iron(III) transport system substrate-binding protein